MEKKTNNKNLGDSGEKWAAAYLQSKGFVVKHQNWRFKRLEIDLIVENDDFIVFVEVKTRSTDFFGRPEEAVDSKKEKRLAKAAEAFVEKFEIEKEVRFDIVAIVGNEENKTIRHIEDAFFPFETYD